MKVPPVLLRLWTPRIQEILRYGIGCGLNLVLKSLLLCLFLKLLGTGVGRAYLYAHIIILFFGFFYHYKVTFLRKFEGFIPLVHSFCKYTAGVILLKCLDWVLVVNGIKSVEPFLIPDGAADWVKGLLHFMIICCSSGILFIIRYLFYRFIFHKKNGENAGEPAK